MSTNEAIHDRVRRHASAVAGQEHGFTKHLHRLLRQRPEQEEGPSS